MTSDDEASPQVRTSTRDGACRACYCPVRVAWRAPTGRCCQRGAELRIDITPFSLLFATVIGLLLYVGPAATTCTAASLHAPTSHACSMAGLHFLTGRVSSFRSHFSIIAPSPSTAATPSVSPTLPASPTRHASPSVSASPVEPMASRSATLTPSVWASPTVIYTPPAVLPSVSPFDHVAAAAARSRALTRLRTAGFVPGDVDAACPVEFRSLMNEYAAFHASARAALAAGAAAPPIVVFGCMDDTNCGGLGDRLPGFIAVFAFALRYRRVLLSQWNASYPWVESHYIDVRIDPAWPQAKEVLTRVADGYLNNCDSDPEAKRACIWSPADPQARFPHWKPAILTTNRGTWSVLHAKPHKEYFLQLVGGHPHCMYWALLQPTEAMLELLRPTLEEFRTRKRVVGLHVRTGDTFLAGNNPSEQNDTILAAARRVRGCFDAETPEHLSGIVPPPRVTRNESCLFVATDSERVRAGLRSAYSCVITTAVKPMHVSPLDMAAAGNLEMRNTMNVREAVRNAFLEWFLLAQCERTVWTIASGFSRTALFYSTTQTQLSTYDRGPCEAKSAWLSPLALWEAKAAV